MSFTVLAFLAILLGFGVLIFVHELGHFLVAKWVNIRCQQFAIGFGPALLAYRKGIGFRSQSTDSAYQQKTRQALKDKGLDPDQTGERTWFATADSLGLGETEYRLNYIPLGGYVKMLGQEDMDPTARSDDPRSYNQKPIWARACVLSAGVVMNVIFGFLFFMIAFPMGVSFPTTIVGNVQANRPASMTYATGHENDPTYRGLQVGDRVLSVNGEKVKDFMEMKLAVALAPQHSDVTLKVKRGSRTLSYTMAPTLSDQGRAKLPSVGVLPMHSLQLGGMMPVGPTSKGTGLDQLQSVIGGSSKTPVKVVAVGGESIDQYEQLYKRVTAAEGKPVAVTFKETDRTGNVKADGKTVTVQLAAEPMLTRDAFGSDRAHPPANALGLTPATRVVAFPEDSASPAKEAGMQAGDLIASLDGAAWPSASRMQTLIETAAKENRALPVHVYRNGQIQSLGRIKPENGRIGIFMNPHFAEPIVARTLPGSPTRELDLPGGSRITRINGEPIADWSDLQRQLKRAIDKANQQANQDKTNNAPQIAPPGETTVKPAATVELTYQLNIAGQPTETNTVEISAKHARHLAAAGWTMPNTLAFDTLRQPLKANGPIEAASLGLEKTNQFIVNTYYTLLRLIQGAISPEAVRGPVGIVDAGTRIAKRGFSWYLFFLGLISINLAVINFLPIPVLDGGHIVFLIIEKIKGSPPSPAVQNAALFAGLALIGSVFLLVTYNDIARLIAGG